VSGTMEVSRTSEPWVASSLVDQPRRALTILSRVGSSDRDPVRNPCECHPGRGVALPLSGLAQSRFFAGALGGISTLSADGKSIVQPPVLSSSSYKPENGAAIDAFAGVHWNDYLSSQVDYMWNENSTALTSLQGLGAFYQQDFSTRQNAVLGSMLIYFRKRSNWVRPYLSVGTGIVRLDAAPDAPSTSNGIQPPQRFNSTAVALHVAVGIDIRVYRGWAFRYSFAETTRSNPISRQLSPPGQRMLANFRSLFGFVKYF